MKNDYVCPNCRGFLNVEQNICFSAKTRDGKVGLIYLNPEVGNYNFIKHNSFDVKDGDQPEFYCPICNANLAAPELITKLSKVIMLENGKDEHEIIFSRVQGERCTYKIKGEKVVPFGEHASKYLSLLKYSK